MKKLAKTCDFEEAENDMVRDRLVLGILDKEVQLKLIKGQMKTLAAVIEEGQVAEISKREVQEVHGRNLAVDQLYKKDKYYEVYRFKNNCKKETAHTSSNSHSKFDYNKTRNEFSKKYNLIKNCNYCKHEARKCPAFGEMCKKCKKNESFRNCLQIKSCGCGPFGRE